MRVLSICVFTLKFKFHHLRIWYHDMLKCARHIQITFSFARYLMQNALAQNS